MHWGIDVGIIEGIVEPVIHKSLLHNLHAVVIVVTRYAGIDVLLHVADDLLQDR